MNKLGKSKEGEKMISVSSDKTAKIWDLKSGKCSLSLANKFTNSKFTCFVWSEKEEQVVLFGDETGTLLSLDLRNTSSTLSLKVFNLFYSTFFANH